MAPGSQTAVLEVQLYNGLSDELTAEAVRPDLAMLFSYAEQLAQASNRKDFNSIFDHRAHKPALTPSRFGLNALGDTPSTSSQLIRTVGRVSYGDIRW